MYFNCEYNNSWSYKNSALYFKAVCNCYGRYNGSYVTDFNVLQHWF